MSSSRVELTGDEVLISGGDRPRLGFHPVQRPEWQGSGLRESFFRVSWSLGLEFRNES